MSIIECRIALTADDYAALVAFYRDGLGLEAGDTWDEHGNGQVLGAGRATLEILDAEHAAHVDSLEVGERVSGRVRFAFHVPDVHAALKNALAYGATLVTEPTLTPWGDLNARIVSPEGMQITLFQTQA